MAIKYYKLLDLLNRRNIKKTDLYSVLTPPVVAKLSKNKPISIDTLDKLCAYLKCQPSDLIEWIPG